jgi:ferritin-like metal-binding protein YciE
MRVTNANSLLEEELKDIYDFEKRLVRAIPKMAKAATSEELRSGLMEHLEVTKNQVKRIEQVFVLLDIPAKAKTCDGMKGIIAEGDEMLQEDIEPTLRDVAIAGAARRVEHYEMAAYSAAIAIAKHLDNNKVADLLKENRDEEREADDQLGKLADRMLRSSASSPGSSAPQIRRAGG